MPPIVPAIQSPHADAFAPRSGLSVWRWILPFAVIALGLRLVPMAASEIAGGHEPAGSGTPLSFAQPGATFPGSAYFYAEGALMPTADQATRRADGLPPQWRGNRHILAIDIGPPPAPHRFAGRTAIDRMRALSCLTNAIYYEGANEPEEGQRAIAQVILNRVRHPDWPNSVCGVVYEGTERDDLRCQFTFACNGAMARAPEPGRWLRARRVAQAALGGATFAPAGHATFYHAMTVFPGWASRMHPVAIIGAHVFYRAPGDAGLPARFRASYAGVESVNGPGANAYIDPRRASFAMPALSALPVADTVPMRDLAPRSPSPAPASVQQASQEGTARGLPESHIKREYLESGRSLR